MLKLIKRTVIAVILLFFAALVLRYYVIPQYILPLKYSVYVEKYSEKYNIDKYLIYAVIHSESSFESEAISHKDAKGLMQITPDTGKWAAEIIGIKDFEEKDLYDPETNIMIGCWYLSRLMKQFNGEEATALAAYNAGSGKVSGWLSDEKYSSDGRTLDTIPYEETLKYVKKVSFIYRLYELVYNSGV